MHSNYEDQDESSSNSDDEDDEKELSDTDVFVPDMLRNVSDARMQAKVKQVKQIFPARSTQAITKALEIKGGRVQDTMTYLMEHDGRPACLGKRKRSRSPSVVSVNCDDEDVIDFKSEYTDEDATLVNEVESSVQPPQPQNHFSVQLTVNIPLGQQEPIVLHLDPKSIGPVPVPPAPKQVKSLVVRLPIRAPTAKRVSARKRELLKAFQKRVGFMDLAPGTSIDSSVL
jgi:hypothetical protein